MADEKKDKKPKKKSKKKSDITSTIFFIILVIGMIVFTIVILKQPKSIIFSKSYGDEIETLVEVYNNGEVDLAVSVNGKMAVQQGKYEVIGEKKKDSYNGKYKLTFVDNKGAVFYINMEIEEPNMTLTYEDGTKIDFKEKKS